MAVYKYVLHHSANTVPKWFLETLGILTSHLNGCSYCVEHHFAGQKRLLGDAARSDAMRRAIETDRFTEAFDAQEQAALVYAQKLTRDPAGMTRADAEGLRTAGYDDGQILEINQVVAYFAYANRTVLGLGVNTDGDVQGLSPGNAADPEDWTHR